MEAISAALQKSMDAGTFSFTSLHGDIVAGEIFCC